jgi:hypothetical protein
MTVKSGLLGETAGGRGAEGKDWVMGGKYD